MKVYQKITLVLVVIILMLGVIGTATRPMNGALNNIRIPVTQFQTSVAWLDAAMIVDPEPFPWDDSDPGELSRVAWNS